MKRNSMLMVAVMVLSVAALACSTLSGGGKTSEVVATAKAVATEVKSAVSTDAPAAASKATPTKSSGGAATPAPSSGDKFSLQSRDAGLDKLKSYRMTWKAEWKATDSGSTESLNWTWVSEYSSEPKSLHFVWNMAGTAAAGNTVNMEFWQVGDTTYMQTQDKSGKKECMSFSSDDPTNQLTKGMFNPSSLGNLRDAKLVGTETVNGIKTKHYKYDEKGAALFGSAKVAGDIWVADEGFVVKETVTFSGAAGLFGATSKSKGDGKWTWELTDANKPITIKPPENCGGASVDLPVMKDAVEKNRMGDVLTYKSSSKLNVVVEFYKKEMPAAGWKLEGEPDVMDELAMMEFVKGDQTAQVMITVDAGKTQVLITVSK